MFLHMGLPLRGSELTILTRVHLSLPANHEQMCSVRLLCTPNTLDRREPAAPFLKFTVNAAFVVRTAHERAINEFAALRFTFIALSRASGGVICLAGADLVYGPRNTLHILRTNKLLGS